MDLGVTLFGLDGAPFIVPTVTLEGNTVRSFELNDWLADAGPAFREGSLQVIYNGKVKELGGILKLVDAEHSLIFDEELTEPAMVFSSSRLEGVWWLPSPKSDMRLAISNTTDATLTATVSVDGIAPRQKETETLTLNPHETRTMDVRDFIAKREGTLLDIGGISISHSGPKGAVLGRAFVEERAKGYSNVVEFIDPGTAKSSRLDGAGLRTSRTGGEELASIAVARNVGTTETTVTGRISYTRADGNTGEASLPPVHLLPGEVKEVNMTAAVSNNGLSENVSAAGLEFEYTSPPGSVVMSAESVSDSENQVFRVPLVDAQAQQSSTGKYPWSINASSSTFVYLKNATGTAQNYLLQVNYDGGAYALGLKTIEAGQTAAFDLRKLRDDQVPDQGGHAIPLDVTHGQVFWSVHGSKDLVLVGRFEQIDTVEGLSSTAACQVCCPATFHEATISPDATTGLSGDTTQFTVQQINWDCNGNPLAPFTPIGVSWTSGNDSVATVDSIGLATAQATGSAAITAMWNATDWVYDPATCNFDDPPPSGGFCNAKGCFGSDGPVGAQATFTVVGVTWTTPHSLNGKDGTVPLASGTPPQNSPAFITSTTITATGSPAGGTYSWSTPNTDKVSLTNTTSATVTVTALKESINTRDVTITVAYTFNSQTVTSQAPFTVQKPTFMAFLSIDKSGAETCPPDKGSGIFKDITWQLQDKNHNPIPYALPTFDTLTNTTPNSCFTPVAGEGTAPGLTTNSAGQWPHHYSLCSTACNNGGNCSVTGTQKYFSNGFEIDQSYTMSCKSITVDGH